jgi:hypothetical protein
VCLECDDKERPRPKTKFHVVEKSKRLLDQLLNYSAVPRLASGNSIEVNEDTKAIKFRDMSSVWVNIQYPRIALFDIP